MVTLLNEKEVLREALTQLSLGNPMEARRLLVEVISSGEIGFAAARAVNWIDNGVAFQASMVLADQLRALR